MNKCKSCSALLTKENWSIAKQKKHYYLCNSCSNKKRRAYYYANHEEEKRRARIQVSERYIRYRNEVLRLLGNRCSNPECPIPAEKLDRRTLQIDHIRNNGNEERKQFSYGSSRGYSSTGYIRFILLKVREGNKDYQLLCPYCNWRKRYLK